MAKNSKNDEGVKLLVTIAGVILLLPFRMVCFASFTKLKQKYLESESTQRVMDIKRLIPIAIGAGGILLVVLAIAAINLDKYSTTQFVAALAIAVGIFAGVMAGRRMAVLYLGIIADKGRDILVFPHDMQSYTVTDYLSVRFLKEYGEEDSVPLSAITKMTRGRGKELYVHGDFGSRGIIMSSKQKRDECLAMIQSATGNKSLLMMEFEGY